MLLLRSISSFTQVFVCLEASISQKKPQARAVTVFTMLVFLRISLFFSLSLSLRLASDDRRVRFKIESEGKSTRGISSHVHEICDHVYFWS